jgi:hypothetical protein
MDQIVEAMQRLQEPDKRIVEEFFWFWPLQAGDEHGDAGLKAIKNGDEQGAIAFWKASIGEGSVIATVAKHNLAVANHLRALDDEASILDGVFHSNDQLHELEVLWRSALGYWDDLAEDEHLWSLVADRIREVNDPRLTQGFARRMRMQLQRAFDQINATLALEFAEAGSVRLAKVQLDYIMRSGRSSVDRDNALMLVLRPTEARINAAVKEAKQTYEASDSDGVEATERLLDVAVSSLSAIGRLVEKTNVVRSYLEANVFDAGFQGCIRYGNKTEDWPIVLTHLRRIEPYAGPHDRGKLDSNLAIIENNIKENQSRSVCWFCKKSAPNAAAVVKVTMFGDVKRGGGRVTWNNLTVDVPRCLTCQAAHKKRTTVGVLCGLGGIVVGNLIELAVRGTTSLCVGTVVGFCVGLAVGSMAYKTPGVAEMSEQFKFPRVLDLKKQGWQVGQKPPGVN